MLLCFSNYKPAHGSMYAKSALCPQQDFPVFQAMLHVWVMIVLMTYQPEIHGKDYLPSEGHN